MKNKLTSHWIKHLVMASSVAVSAAVISGCETSEALMRDIGISGAPQTNTGPTLSDQRSVARAQELLKALGYAPGGTDGIPGPRTRAAVTNFQRSKRVVADGRITDTLLAQLRNEHLAQNPGSISAEVAEAQRKDKLKGTIGGMLAGAATAIAAKDEMNVSTAEAALGGALIGGTAGSVVGNKAADARGTYAQQNAALDLAFQERSKALDEISARSRRAETELENKSREIERLQQRILTGESDNEELEKAITQLEKDIKANQRLARDMRIQIDLASQDIAAIEAEINKFPNNNDLVSHKANLTAKRDDLVVSMNAINGITPEIQKQQDALISQRKG